MSAGRLARRTEAAWWAGEVERERGRGVVQVRVRAFWMWVRRKGGNLLRVRIMFVVEGEEGGEREEE